MADVLGVDQNYDLVTQYGFAFRHKFIFQKFSTDFPSHTLYQSNNAKAVRSVIDGIITKNSIRYITAMGHGMYAAFTGQNGAIVWDAAEDLSYLKGTIVHLLSCQTGASLGRKMVADGVSAFWGYTVNFAFRHEGQPPTELSDDTTAAIYLRMDAIIDRGILAGKKSQPIYDSVQSYVARVIPQLTPADRATLLDNYVHLVCPSTTWGSPSVTL